MEQLNTPDMVYNITIYSEKTDSYYCILNEYAHTEHIYEIWDGYLHKNDAAILQLFERANGTYRTAVMYAKGAANSQSVICVLLPYPIPNRSPKRNETILKHCGVAKLKQKSSECLRTY